MNRKDPDQTKLVILFIIEILKQETSGKDKTITQQKIVSKLEEQFNIHIDQRTVSRHLKALKYYSEVNPGLINTGCTVDCANQFVRIKNGNESEVCSKWYMEKYFSNEELRVLVDGLVFSKLITAKQAKELIKKVETLGDSNFSSKIDYVQILTDKKIGNEELFQNISKIDEAIKDKKKIRFIYNSYDIDKKLHPRKNSKGEMKEYLVNPYQIIAEAGRYYLLCNYDKYDNLSHYKLDLITNIQTTDKTVKKRERVKGFGQEFNLPEHLAEQIYMLEGTNVWVEFTVKKDVLDSVIDWFGDNIEFRKYKSDDEVLARVNVNMKAMRFWALQYGNYVKVLNPPELVSEIKEDIRNIAEKYKN